MFEYKTTGKTINQAIESGLKALNLQKEQVEIKVIKQPSGFKPAVVVLCVDDSVLGQNEKAMHVVKLTQLEEQIAKTENLLKASLQEKEDIIENLTTQILQSEGAELDDNQVGQFAKQFVENILKLGGCKNCTVEVKVEDEFIKLLLWGHACKRLIGFKGRTLSSLQQIVNVFVEKISSRKAKKVVVDVNDYKANREQVVRALAQEKIKEVQETQTEIALSPMNAFERRIVHNEVSKVQNLASESVGVEPKRFVVIKFQLADAGK